MLSCSLGGFINVGTKSNDLVTKKSQQQKAGRPEKGQKRGHIRGTKKGRSVTKSEQGEITETQFLPPVVWAVSSPVVGGLGCSKRLLQRKHMRSTALHCIEKE